MRIIRAIKEFKELRKDISNKSIGFVATMGNLHAGHQSLIERSVQENDCTVLSIFVNPTQFNNPKDIAGYPRTIEQDIACAKKCGVDYLLMPEYEEMYKDNYTFKITEDTELSTILEGKYRPGHFTGMLTIVMKLFSIVRPDRTYFGEKDYQQFLLVKMMAKAFLLDVEVIGMPTVRDVNGLALSSRNNLLSDEQLKGASLFSRLLASNKLSERTIELRLLNEDFKVDYIERYHGRRFGAVWLGGVRLIDNCNL